MLNSNSWSADLVSISDSRLLALIDSYGGNVARWPVDEQSEAVSLLIESKAGQAAFKDARRLDDLLNASDELRTDELLKSTIDNIPIQHPRSRDIQLTMLWPFGTLWWPAGGLLAAALFGFFLGSADHSFGSAEIDHFLHDLAVENTAKIGDPTEAG